MGGVERWIFLVDLQNGISVLKSKKSSKCVNQLRFIFREICPPWLNMFFTFLLWLLIFKKKLYNYSFSCMLQTSFCIDSLQLIAFILPCSESSKKKKIFFFIIFIYSYFIVSFSSKTCFFIVHNPDNSLCNICLHLL